MREEPLGDMKNNFISGLISVPKFLSRNKMLEQSSSCDIKMMIEAVITV